MPLLSRVGRRRRGFGIVAAFAVVLAVGVVGEPVEAAGTAHATWVVTPPNPPTTPNWTGTATIPATDFPVASFTTTSNSPSTPVAAFLNATTPYGAVFGTTQTRNYLSAAATTGQAPSTTTFTFASPTPSSGWGFAFGDIDADQLTIRASGPGGPLTSAQLGFSGTFNYCTVATPRPSSCGGVQTDVPTWNPATATLVGNGLDTGGASGWFRPTVPITSLTLTYSVLTGIPSFQMWMSSLTFDITGTVRLDTGAAAPPGTSLQLVDADGNVVATTPALADGSYRFTPLAPAAYTVRVVPPSGYQVVGPAVRPADARASDVLGIDFALTLVLATTTTTSTTTTSTSTTTTTTTLPPTTSTTTTTLPPTTTSSTTLPPTTSTSTTTTLPPTTTTTTTTLPPTTTSTSTTSTTLPPTTTTSTTTTTTVPPTTTSTSTTTPTTSSSTTTTLPPTTTSSTTTTTTLPPTTTSSTTTTTLPPTTTSSTTTTTLPPTTTSSTTTTTLPPTTTSSTTTTTLPPPPAGPTTTMPTSTTSTTVLATTTTSTTSTTVVGPGSAGGLTRSPIATPTRRPGQLPATGTTTTGNVLVLAAVVLGGGLALMVLARRDPRAPPAR